MGQCLGISIAEESKGRMGEGVKEAEPFFGWRKVSLPQPQGSIFADKFT